MNNHQNNDFPKNNNNDSVNYSKLLKSFSKFFKKNKIRKSNPDIFHLNLNSSFLY